MVRDRSAPQWRRAPNTATRQHIIARRLGGSNSQENLRPCCLQCNGLLDLADDCPGALACARGMAMGGPALIRRILMAWRRQRLATVPF